MILYARSPYFIIVNEAAQVGSKIEIRIWNDPNSKPTEPTYTLKKSIASTSQRANTYNISPFIREYIDSVKPADNTNSMLAKVEVKRFKETSVGVYPDTPIDTITYYATAGYTNYSGGYNQSTSISTIKVLANTSLEYFYEEGIAEADYPYVNVWADNTSPAVLQVTYKDLRGRNEVTNTITRDGVKLYKIPLRTSSIKYDKGNTCTIKWRPTGEYTDDIATIRVIPVCETKYNPVQCQFINRYGGWQFLTFFKAQSNSMQVMGTTYKLLPDAVNYNASRAQTKSFNINGSQTVRLNTGWLPENYNELIQDLLLAETILLDNVPVEIKTTQTDLKTSLRDRNINYELEFEYAFDLINNVI
jgi:hypothetical protein